MHLTEFVPLDSNGNALSAICSLFLFAFAWEMSKSVLSFAGIGAVPHDEAFC